MFGGITEAGVRCCECRRTPTLGRIRVCRPAGVAGYVGLPSTTECQNNGYQQPRRSDERVPAVMVRFHASHSSARFLILDSPFSLFIFSFLAKGIGLTTDAGFPPDVHSVDCELITRRNAVATAAPLPMVMLE